MFVRFRSLERRSGRDFTGLNVAANWDKINVKGPIYVGSMTKIEDGATIIGPAMIGPSCHICEGGTIDNSIIFDYSRIGPGVRLVEKLVFGRYCVDRNGEHFDLQEAALDWLITDVRRQDVVAPSPQQKAMAELLGGERYRQRTRSDRPALVENLKGILSSAFTAIR
jgi:mannose-1-phosphate guanylyltransferase